MLLSASRPITSLSGDEALAALQTGRGGLSVDQAARRLERFGANRLPPPHRRPLLLRFSDHLRHFMALLLWVAGALAFVARTPQLGWAIWSVVWINALFSFWQDYQAERTLTALSQVMPRLTRVWRAGVLQELPAEQLVPGDLIELEEGDHVPADARLLLAAGLMLDLAVLTGEALPVARDAAPTPPAEQPALRAVEAPNLVLAGCTVLAGHARAVVYATGAETEFGQVAHLSANVSRAPSTLELQVHRIVHTITAIALSMGALTFTCSLLFVGMAPLESLVFAIGIIVANVPEGLLPTVTLALALAVQRMAREQALVRRLSAVDTLGAVSVICTDKTGTLTANAMAVQDTWSSDPQLLLLLAALCSNATATRGDPTETALLRAAEGSGVPVAQERQQLARLQERPFDSQRRLMSVLVAWNCDRRWPEPAAQMAITKGAPLELLARCDRWLRGGRAVPLSSADRALVASANDVMARQGYRVLAVACRPAPDQLLDEQSLVLVGLVGLYDPPRPGVVQAIAACRRAGIKVTMVTGDYGLTAQALARQIGLLDSPAHAAADPVRVIHGDDLTRLSDLQLRQLIKFRSRLVFARMAPEQKLRLVQAYRALGDVVAVTGDGVNDAPALRAADVGLAMGRNGTDVARQAADIVLLDDNFATIVSAIRQGRGVYSNIRKFITYILASNVPELAPFLAMLLLRIPAALTVLQILAVDLGTDLLPALGLGAEPPEDALMRQPPRSRHEPLLNRALLLRAYLWLGLVEAVLAMAAYGFSWAQHGVSLAELQALAPQLLHNSAPPALVALQRQASTVSLGVIVFAQIGTLLACRTEWRPFWVLAFRPNRLLWSGVVLELLAYATLPFLEPLATTFQVAPIPSQCWWWLLACTPAPLLADELRKAWVRRQGRAAHDRHHTALAEPS